MMVVFLAVAMLVTAPAGADASAHPSRAASVQHRVHKLEQRVVTIRRMVRRMERSAAEFRVWMKCITLVPVSEYGDPDHRFGFAYEERDGTPTDLRPALALHTDAQTRPGLALLKFSRSPKCRSAATVPGGTADPAWASSAGLRRLDTVIPAPRAMAWVAKKSGDSLDVRIRKLRRNAGHLQSRLDRLNRMADRFDGWESCLSWLPTTQYGDADGRFGYALTNASGEFAGYRPALAIDTSEWDDPDYELLAFVGRDRPFTKRECAHEPGESVD
jgi:hypothetical protein